MLVIEITSVIFFLRLASLSLLHVAFFNRTLRSVGNLRLRYMTAERKVAGSISGARTLP